MKFKSVVHNGPNKGDVVEYSSEEKVPVAAEQAAIEHEAFKEYAVWASGFKLGSVATTPKGLPLKNKWQNNVYQAKGEMTLNRRHKASDSLHQPQHIEFEIEFEDCLCDRGMPDLKITKFTPTTP